MLAINVPEQFSKANKSNLMNRGKIEISPLPD
jgi:hypothetical protein